MNHFHTSRARLPRRLARIASAACLVAAGLATGVAAHAQSDTKTLKGVFTSVDNAPDWTIAGSRYNVSQLPTTDGSGWLRLTSLDDGIISLLKANAKIASGVPVRVEFDWVYWGGPYGNLAVYFADASAPSAGKNGKGGAASGYCGMSGAYLGIAMDEGGWFSRWHCGLGGEAGIAQSGNPGHGNAVAVRGPQSSDYPYVTSASIDDQAQMCGTCTDRDQALGSVRRVVIDLVPRSPANSGYVLSAKVNGREVLKGVDFPYAPPAELLMGIASTTGAGAANNEIRDLKVSVQGTVTAVDCLNGVGPDGMCMPVENEFANYAVWSVVDNAVVDQAPPELIDGNLAQRGWDGKHKSPAVPSILEPNKCYEMGIQWRSGDKRPPEVEQLVIVSRQDDWQNAVEPSESMVFTKHGAVDIEVSYSTDFSQTWNSLPAIVDNNKVMRVLDLPKGTTITNAHVSICKTADGKTAPMTELLLRKKL